MKSLDLQKERKQIENENAALNRTMEEQHAEEANEKEGKTYTQSEVNEIIRERLRRERAKAAPTPEEVQATDLASRELRLSIKEFLISCNMPVDHILEFFDEMELDSLDGFMQTFYSMELLAKEICEVSEKNRELSMEQIAKSKQEQAIRNEYELAGIPRHLRGCGSSLLKQIFNKGGLF